MLATTTSPARSARPDASPPRGAGHDWSGLRVEREDIVFTTVRPGIFRVEIRVTNAGARRTEPTVGVIQSAPLGAFVPWTFLDVVRVPGLAPGESTVVGGEYLYDTPPALGGLDKLPPDRVLTALGLGEPNREPTRNPAAPTGLATDLLAVLQQGGHYWAGNLNLFFPGKDVERHVAQALRIYPGCVNVAMFVVGATADTYRYELTGAAAVWNARLFDTRMGQPIIDGLSSPALEEGTWHQPLCGLLLLTVEPPEHATTGSVAVRIRQRSSQREAVVEFTMDARAAGPGCYKL
jgi:hypothetical protein